MKSHADPMKNVTVDFDDGIAKVRKILHGSAKLDIHTKQDT